VRRLKKAALQAGKDIAKALNGEKIAKATPTYYEHAANWEIPV